MNSQADIRRTTNADVELDAVLDVKGFNLQRALDLDPAFMEPEYPFEWVGIYLLTAGRHRLELEAGPDPSMKVALQHVSEADGAALAAAADVVSIDFSGDSRRVTPADDLDPDHVLELALERLPAAFDFVLPKGGAYALFTEHHPSEFAAHLVTADVPGVPIVERAFKPEHEHDDEIASVGLDITGEVDGRRINAWLSELLRTRGTDIFRMKGVLAIRDAEHRVIFQGVHMLLESSPDRPWRPGEERRSTIVFIGRNLDREAIEGGFRACLA
ncbi:MAG: GTP-binding protein [Gaiellaceae bacterium MAG52_C11]|nr:GTP-binding protein [Candidatus Gaiellasilicea maunaloa]